MKQKCSKFSEKARWNDLQFVTFSRKLWINRLLIFQGPKVKISISIHSSTFDLINKVEDIIVLL